MSQLAGGNRDPNRYPKYQFFPNCGFILLKKLIKEIRKDNKQKHNPTNPNPNPKMNQIVNDTLTVAEYNTYKTAEDICTLHYDGITLTVSFNGYNWDIIPDVRHNIIFYDTTQIEKIFTQAIATHVYPGTPRAELLPKFFAGLDQKYIIKFVITVTKLLVIEVAEKIANCPPAFVGLQAFGTSRALGFEYPEQMLLWLASLPNNNRCTVYQPHTGRTLTVVGNRNKGQTNPVVDLIKAYKLQSDTFTATAYATHFYPDHVGSIPQIDIAFQTIAAHLQTVANLRKNILYPRPPPPCALIAFHLSHIWDPEGSGTGEWVNDLDRAVILNYLREDCSLEHIKTLITYMLFMPQAPAAALSINQIGALVHVHDNL